MPISLFYKGFLRVGGVMREARGAISSDSVAATDAVEL
jgi:hypothetical protein